LLHKINSEREWKKRKQNQKNKVILLLVVAVVVLGGCCRFAGLQLSQKNMINRRKERN